MKTILPYCTDVGCDKVTYRIKEDSIKVDCLNCGNVKTTLLEDVPTQTLKDLLKEVKRLEKISTN